MARLGLDAAYGDELPSAFDSEDEDDDDVHLDDFQAKTSAMGSKRGVGRCGNIGR